MSVLVSSTGDGMFVTALPLLAASLTADPLLIAGIAVATRLPWLLFSMLTGAAADRMDRRRLLVVADLSRLLVVGLLGVAVLTDIVSIWGLYVCAFVLGIGETLHVNAAQAILPALVEPRDLMQANARFATAQIAAAQFAGPPLGAALYRAGTALPFLGDAASFAVSAALVGSLPDTHRVEPTTTRVRDDVVDGLRFVFGHAALRRITTVLAIVNAAYFAAASLLVLYNDEQLGGSELTFTLLFVGGAAGTVISRFVVSPLVLRIGSTATIAVALWTWAITTAGLAATDDARVAVAMFVVLGIGNGLWMAVTTTIRQQLTPTRMLGRMNAAFRTVSWGVVPFGAAVGGLVARWSSIRVTFAIAATVMSVVAVAWRRVLAPVAAAIAVTPRAD